MAQCCTEQRFKPVTHVIFDMDGLLLDSERIYTECTQNIVTQYGKTYTRDIKEMLMGLTGVESAKRIVEMMNLPITWQEYAAQAQEQYKQLMPHTKLMPVAGYGKKYTPEVKAKVVGTTDMDTSRTLVKELKLPLTWEELFERIRRDANSELKRVDFMPGVERLVKHLHAKSIPIAVATSSAESSYEIKTALHRHFFKLFAHVVMGSDAEVKRGKPHPDIFLVCASRFPDKPKPQQCLVFEDSAQGVKGAVAAGMQCVMVPEASIHASFCKPATLLLSNLNEFVPELFGLPAYE